MITKKHSTKIKKPSLPLRQRSKTHTVDGFNYKTKTMANLHREWKNDKLIKSFSLPTSHDASNNHSKFGSLKAMVNDIVFDSVMEARYYVHLLHEKSSKLVTNINLQVKFELMPQYIDECGKTVKPITYVADFTYIDTATKKVHIVDVKGVETPEFKIKWKLLGYLFPEYIRDCIQWRASQKKWLSMSEIKKIRKTKKRKELS